MALGQILKLGGMDNSTPRTQQSLGRFRVARNVVSTGDGYIVPRTAQESLSLLIPRLYCVHHITRYVDGTFIAVVSTKFESSNTLYIPLSFYKIDKDWTTATLIPKLGGSGDGAFSGEYTRTYDRTQGVTSTAINGTVFFVNPTHPRTYNSAGFGAYIKYDGLEISGCGSLQPSFASADRLDTGTKFIRVIRHCMDFDMNEPVSEYVQFRTSTTTTLRINGSGPTMVGTSAEVKPSTPLISAFSEDDVAVMNTPNWHTPTSVTYNSNNTLTVVLPGNRVTDLLNKRVFCTNSFMSGADLGLVSAGLPVGSLCLSLKAIEATYDSDNNRTTVIYGQPLALSEGRVWIGNVGMSATTATKVTYGVREFYTVWASNAETANYVYRGTVPATNREYTVDVSSVTAALPTRSMFSISPNLGDWYDTTVRRYCLNSVDIAGVMGASSTGKDGRDRLRGVTQYNGMVIVYTQKEAWYSDTLSYDQSGYSFRFTQGSDGEGEVISLCGTPEILLFSRERNNWVLNGDISTGNVRVQEVTNMELGAWSNNATILIQNFIFVVTSNGIYMVSESGASRKVTDRVPLNFNRYSQFPVNEDIAFSLTGPSGLVYNRDAGLAITYDEGTGYLVVCQKGINTPNNPALVLDVVSGEIFEWTHIAPQDTFVSTLFFDNGYLVCAYNNGVPASTVAGFTKESDSVPLDGAVAPIKLYTSWMTGGTPSLEKNVKQAKFFGKVFNESADKTVKVVSFNDWDSDSKITDDSYIPDYPELYSHKKRLNSSKALASSVGIEVGNKSTFQIEGMEVEFDQIQVGMKR